MAFLNISSKNVKFTILNDTHKKLCEDDCFMEIVISRNFLDDFLKNIVMLQDTSYIGDFTLTKRERQVLKYLSLGNNNSQIAEKLNVSIHTTKVHIHNIFNKLSVQDRTEAAVKAIKYNLIDI